MRDIKFNYVWKSDRTSQIKETAVTLQELESKIGDYHLDGYSLIARRQYIGLKDKNGTAIYEDDSVRILYTDWPSQASENNGRYSMSLDEYKKSISHYGKVVYSTNDGCASFVVEFGDDISTIDCGTHGEIEVIADLLTKELEKDDV